jgi:hypothetical protein
MKPRKTPADAEVKGALSSWCAHVEWATAIIMAIAREAVDAEAFIISFVLL